MLDWQRIVEHVREFWQDNGPVQTREKATTMGAKVNPLDVISLPSILPYHDYDVTTQLFHNQRSMGFVMEMAPLLGAGEDTIKLLESLVIDNLSPELDCQVLLVASPTIGQTLYQYQAARSEAAPVYQWLAQKRVDFFKGGVGQSLLAHEPYVCRDIRIFWVISAKKGPQSENKLLSCKEIWQHALSSIGSQGRCLDAQQFLYIISELLMPRLEADVDPIHWDEAQSLHAQMGDPECLLHVHANDIRAEHRSNQQVIRAYVAKEFPGCYAQYQMNDIIGHLFQSSRQIPSPFAISLHFRLRDKERSRAMAQMKFLNKDRHANSPLRRLKPSLSKEQQDWHEVRGRLDEGDTLADVYFQVVLFANEHTIAEAERRLLDLYRTSGWVLKVNRYLQMQSYLALCPMMVSEGLWDDLNAMRQTRLMTATNAVSLAPLQGEYKGTATPAMLLPGRRGQLARWFAFDNSSGNYNMAIAAKSGSGKSVFVQEYIVSLLGLGGRAWVIDAGRSYEKTCRLLGGSFIDFSPEKHLCLNPFSDVDDIKEAAHTLIPLLAAMARPSGQVIDEELRYLELAVFASWEAKGQATTISDVASTLTAQGHTILATLLYPYTAEGRFGHYFEGTCNLDFSNPLVVLELDDLKNRKDLRHIVLMVLMYQISQAMYLGDRKQFKSCVIDEAWDLMHGNTSTAHFIEAGYRTARRYRGNFITVTQSLADYFKNPMAEAAYGSSDIKVMLSQLPETLEQVKERKQLSLNGFSERLYKSLRTVSGDYAECVLRTPEGESVHRLILDPYAAILYSSKGEEFQRIKELEAQGLSLTESIEVLANERY